MVDRPAPDEELNTGEEIEPRQAATAIVLRDGEHGLEVLLVQRNPEASFMGGAWVFPGGALSEDDDGHAAAALRELEEEAGVRIEDVGRLVPYSRWIRPADALRAGASDELMLVFPTIKHLEQLAELDSVEDALRAARAREVVAIQPRVVVADDGARVLLPGEPGYDE